MKVVGLSTTVIYVLIYDERGVFSISKQDSLNLLNNLDCLDFSYIYDSLSRKTKLQSHLEWLNNESLQFNQVFLLNKMETKNIADSMNSNRSCNRTNDEFTSFGGIETQRICDEVKLTFKLKYNYNINKTIDNNEINCFMSTDKIPPKVIQKHDSRSLLEKSSDSSSELNNDSLVNDCDFDYFSSKSNNDSS